MTASSDAVLWWRLKRDDQDALASPCCRLVSDLGRVQQLAADARCTAAAVGDGVYLLAPQATGPYGRILAVCEDRAAPSPVMALAFAPQHHGASGLWVACEDRGFRVWEVAQSGSDGPHPVSPTAEGEEEEAELQTSPRYRSALLGPSPLVSCTVSLTGHGSVRAAIGDAAGVLRIFDAASGDYRLLGEIDVAHAVATHTGSEAGCLRTEKAAAHSDDPLLAVAGARHAGNADSVADGAARPVGAASCQRAGLWICALQDAVAVIDMDTLNFVHVCRWHEHGGPLGSAGTCTLSTRSLADGSIESACLVASPFAREAQVLHLSLPSAADIDVAASKAFVGPGRAAADIACDVPALSLQAKATLPPESPLRALLEPKVSAAGSQVGRTGVYAVGTGAKKKQKTLLSEHGTYRGHLGGSWMP